MQTFSQALPPMTICVNAALENKGRLFPGRGRVAESGKQPLRGKPVIWAI